MFLVVILTIVAANPALAPSGDVPVTHEAAWTACRNEKGNVTFDDEMKGCEALIAADGIDNEIKAIAHANRGMLMTQTMFLQTARDELDRAIKLNPRLAPAYYNRAMLKEATRDPQGAIADYSTAIGINPKLVEAFINRGIARAKLGQNEPALADFNRAIELEPGSADLYENRAALFREMGRSDEAEADIAKAKQLAK